MKKVSKIGSKKKYSNMLTSSFRELIDKELGALDVATSFMYLFRRFGAPNLTNDDEYKILFDYRLKHKDLIIAIHGSYHSFVYFTLFLPQGRLNRYNLKRKKLYKT